MLAVVVYLQAAWTARSSARDDRGQASVEYALVLLGAAALAVLIVAWATKTDKVGKLFDFVFDQVSKESKQ